MTDKEKIRKEVEKLKLCTMDEHMKFYSEAAEAEYNALCNIEYFIDSLQEGPMSKDLEEAVKKYLTSLRKSHFEGYDIERAFKKGAQWQKERMLNSAMEREVKVDAGGYPYIDATELYDYDKDKPIAKKGDKVKLIIIKDE